MVNKFGLDVWRVVEELINYVRMSEGCENVFYRSLED